MIVLVTQFKTKLKLASPKSESIEGLGQLKNHE